MALRGRDTSQTYGSVPQAFPIRQREGAYPEQCPLGMLGPNGPSGKKLRPTQLTLSIGGNEVCRPNGKGEPQ